MSLFAVQRYLGEEDKVDEKQRATDFLKELQEKAKAKRRSLKDAEKKSAPLHQNDSSVIDIKVDANEEGQKKKLKKYKQVNSTESTEISEESKVVKDDSFETVTKKRKKRKCELSETSFSCVELKNEEGETPNKKVKEKDFYIEETGEVVKYKHKSQKKHKRKYEDGSKTEIVGTEKENSDTGSNSYSSKKEETVTEDADMQSDDEEREQDEDKSSIDKDSDEKVASVKHGKETEIGGFTVIGNVRRAKLGKVQRVLPEWLSKPSIISSDLGSDKLPVSEMAGLDRSLMDKLGENGITDFFPVQRQVIPSLLETSLTGFHIGRAGYRPSDLCVSAPTGSGKTLAFVLPIIQALKSRVTCEVRALAVLPVRDLATQVFNVFKTYSEGTNLKVGLAIGQKTLLAEQQSLVQKRLPGYESLVDIIVATPGRLVDHINQTEGFNLGHLRYLVIDEADRMMDEIKQDWLIQVETAVYQSRPHPQPLTASSCRKMDTPLQKLLYSATLSQNPEKLQQLNLFQPKLFTSVVKTRNKSSPSKTLQKKTDSLKSEPHLSHDSGIDNEEESVSEASRNETLETEIKTEETEMKAGDFVGKYATPSGLTEYCIETDSEKKPLVVLHLLHHLKYRKILCFTNTVETAHRLCLLIRLYGGVVVKEFSSNFHVARRKDMLQKFEDGKIDILVCSDAMARGMDLPTVKYVVSYDTPSYIQTYIHRIGRTARAGKEGTAFTLLQSKEFFHFKKMMRQAGKGNLKTMKVYKNDLKPLLPKYEETLKQLGDKLKNEKPKRRYTPRKLPKQEIKDKTE